MGSEEYVHVRTLTAVPCIPYQCAAEGCSTVGRSDVGLVCSQLINYTLFMGFVQWTQPVSCPKGREGGGVSLLSSGNTWETCVYICTCVCVCRHTGTLMKTCKCCL